MGVGVSIETSDVAAVAPGQAPPIPEVRVGNRRQRSADADRRDVGAGGGVRGGAAPLRDLHRAHRAQPARGLLPDVPRLVRDLVLVPEHAAARGAADADGAGDGAAAAARAGRDRRRGRDGDGRARGGGRGGRPAPATARWRSRAAMLLAGALVGGLWIALRRRAARLPRRQRDHRDAAAQLHRDRAAQPHRRGPAARSGEPEQAVDAAHRRRQHARQPARASTCTGAWSGASSRACSPGC